MLQLLQTVLVTGCMLIATALSRLHFQQPRIPLDADRWMRRKICPTRRHLLPDVYVIKPNKQSAFLVSADSLRCDFSYICMLKTLLCSSQHFRISFAGMFYAGRSYHLAAKGSRHLQRAMQVLVTGMIF